VEREGGSAADLEGPVASEQMNGAVRGQVLQVHAVQPEVQVL
jgi:hypothetical protein